LGLWPALLTVTVPTAADTFPIEAMTMKTPISALAARLSVFEPRRLDDTVVLPPEDGTPNTPDDRR
jgi:hypothetical protein